MDLKNGKVSYTGIIAGIFPEGDFAVKLIDGSFEVNNTDVNPYNFNSIFTCSIVLKLWFVISKNLVFEVSEYYLFFVNFNNIVWVNRDLSATTWSIYNKLRKSKT